MSEASRRCGIGAVVETKFAGHKTLHQVIERKVGAASQSGVMFIVKPIVPGSTGEWIDADWFEPAVPEKYNERK